MTQIFIGAKIVTYSSSLDIYCLIFKKKDKKKQKNQIIRKTSNGSLLFKEHTIKWTKNPLKTSQAEGIFNEKKPKIFNEKTLNKPLQRTIRPQDRLHEKGKRRENFF